MEPEPEDLSSGPEGVTQPGKAGGFSVAAFVFPFFWPFAHGLPGLGLLGLGTALLTLAVRLWLLLGGRPGPNWDGLFATFLVLAAIELSVNLFIGFRAKGLYWRKYPDRLSPEQFVRRQANWNLAVIALAIGVLLLSGSGPHWVTSRWSLRPTFYGISFNDGYVWSSRPLTASDDTTDNPTAFSTLPAGSYEVAFVKYFSATADFPETMQVVTTDDSDAKRVYRVIPTLWTKWKIDGQGVSRSRFLEDFIYSDRNAYKGTLTVNSLGEMQTVDATGEPRW